MWDELKMLPSILVGQSIFSFLDLESIVRLETAVASIERVQTVRSFLTYFTKEDVVKVNIPEEITKLKWLQVHDYPIAKAIVHLDKINSTFETNTIKGIELIGLNSNISTELHYLPATCYEKIVSVCFDGDQDVDIMENLFSRLIHLSEVSVNCRPEGWILSILRGLHRRLGNNVPVEKVRISLCGYREGSVAEIAKYCPRLQSLTLRFPIAEDSLLALSRHCPLLKKLKIDCILRISTEQSAALCAPVLSCIQTIQTPYIIGQEDDDVTDYVMAVPYLTGLQAVIGGSRLDNVLLPLISQHCLQLECVAILLNSTTTSDQLLQLAQNCPHLHSIFLSCSITITDDLVIGLAERCPILQRLVLQSYRGIHAVTDASLLALSEHCPQLCELGFHNCMQLTEAAVLQFIHICKHLHILKLPLACLSEDTVLALPVSVSHDDSVPLLTLTFNT